MRERRAGAPEQAPQPERLALAPDELAALVGSIVQVTLDTRLPDCAPARRAALAAELETRLRGLFGLRASPSPVRELPSSAENAAPLDEAPARAAPPLDTSARSSPNWPPGMRALGLVLDDRLGRLGGLLAEREDLRQHLITLALRALDASAEPHSASPDDLRNLDVLARRAQKLERALQDARAALAYVAGLTHVDQGLASIYRNVQGISGDDPRRVQKHDALERIFQANFALQKRAE